MALENIIKKFKVCHTPLIEKSFDNFFLRSMSIFISATILFYEATARYKYHQSFNAQNSFLLLIGISFLLLPFIKTSNMKLRRHLFSGLLMALSLIRFIEVDIMSIPLKNMFPVIIFGIYMVSGLSYSLIGLVFLTMALIIQPYFNLPPTDIPYNKSDFTILFIIHTSISLVVLYLNHIQMKEFFTDFIYKKKAQVKQDYLNQLSDEVNPLLNECISDYKRIMMLTGLTPKKDRNFEKVYLNLKQIEKNNFNLSEELSEDK